MHLIRLCSAQRTAPVPVCSCCWERNQPTGAHKVCSRMLQKRATSSWWSDCQSRCSLWMTPGDKNSSRTEKVKTQQLVSMNGQICNTNVLTIPVFSKTSTHTTRGATEQCFDAWFPILLASCIIFLKYNLHNYQQEYLWKCFKRKVTHSTGWCVLARSTSCKQEHSAGYLKWPVDLKDSSQYVVLLYCTAV